MQIGVYNVSNLNEIINRQIHYWDRIKDVLCRGKSIEDMERGIDPSKHHRPVIAFSRNLGCGSRSVIDILSHCTGYEIFGCSLIDQVAKDMHVQRQVIDRLDESVRSEIEVLVEGMMHGYHIDQSEYFHSLVRVLRAFIVQGDVILLGRGACNLVRKGEGLRVRLTASIETRIRNLCGFNNFDEATALAKIKESDHQRKEFVHKFFHVNIDDPDVYDISINTDNINPESAASVILRTIEEMERSQ
jgi:cytidylate kinase